MKNSGVTQGSQKKAGSKALPCMTSSKKHRIEVENNNFARAHVFGLSNRIALQIWCQRSGSRGREIYLLWRLKSV